MRLVSNYILLLVLLTAAFSNAQYRPTKNYSTADGLTNNAVRSLFLDKNQELWIGTENGISKFENGHFSSLVLPKIITNNSCWDIAQDTQGNMWFATYGGGVFKYDGEKYSLFDTGKGLPDNRAHKLLSYNDKIYVGTELGVAIIDIKTNKLVVPNGIVPHFGVFIVTYFMLYKDEVYFSTSNEGIFKIVVKDDIPHIEQILAAEHAFSLGQFGSQLFVGNKASLNQFEIENVLANKAETRSFGSTTVWDYAADKQGILYAAAWGVFDQSGGLYTVANNGMTPISKEYGVDSPNILNVIYNSKNDFLYVGSKDRGIYEVQLGRTIDYNPFANKKVIDFEIFDTHKVIVHGDGLSFLDGSNVISKTITNEAFKKYEVGYVTNSENKVPTHKEGYFELDYKIPATQIEYYGLIKHQQSLWLTSNIGIYEISLKGEIINYIPLHSYKIGFTNNNKFIETIPYAGVRIYDDVYNLKAKHYSEFDKDTPLNVVGILNNRDKTYFISLFQGLYTYINNKCQSLLSANVWKEDKLKFITKNQDGNLIIASELSGITIVDDSRSFKILQKIPKGKLLGNTINFLESYKNYILIGTDLGINIYHDGNLQLFDKDQGLKDAEIISAKLSGNTLWLGTKKGFYTVNLDKLIAEKNTVSSIEIKDIKINSVPISRKHFKWMRYTETALLCDYSQNTIAIDFVPKGHSYSNKLKFRYRLKESNQWSPYSDKPFVYLSYLPADAYKLEIEVTDMHSGKVKTFSILDINIKHPFWETTWFMALIALITIIIIVLITANIKKQAKQKAVNEREISKAKLEALLSQMNPHFTFNALTSIQSFVFNKDVINSSIYISEVANLMRQTLDNSSKQAISIENEIHYLQTYILIENKRFNNRIVHKITIDADLNQEQVSIPTMLLQPFIENIFKHAFDDKHINPEFEIAFKKLNQEYLQISITDNGYGKKEMTSNHNSKGLSIATERLKIMQPNNVNPIEVKFSETGTTVVITLFLDREN
ncbi:sensor histidine kinase [Flavobacterium frigidarium]|uniref:sensor histidine kinase n=1 Tax=Flavobacterium frigidarium TaxID=99286 RepID=UPI00047993C5|nr:histidine kinase [Flavobacterium frigidarium]